MEIRRLIEDTICNLDGSTFLFGIRQVGKTWLLKKKVPADIYIDLLKKSELIRYLKNPEILFDEIKALNKSNAIVIIDEIQKTPGLLDEVHRIMESELNPEFILTGSSARKLKKTHANMLGGRALTLKLFPFCYLEIKDDFSLKEYLHFGGLPKIYTSSSRTFKQSALKSYLETYLKEEIVDEANIRNLPAFTKFLDLAGFENGHILNYSTIAREIGISSIVVKEYFSILEESWLGFYLQPYYKSHRKRIINHPKFYFIDTGLVFAIKKMLSMDLEEGTPLWGEAFEHFIILEIVKYINYFDPEMNPWFFRTSDGAEVDLILEKHGKIVAIEIKASTNPRKLSGLHSFLKDHLCHQAYCVCQTPRKFIRDKIEFINWKEFIEMVYAKRLFT